MELNKESSVNRSIHETFSYGIIYVYSIPDEAHKGRLKIGSATLSGNDKTQAAVEMATHARIKQQTKTADIRYELLHSELAITDKGEYLSDYTVHDILKRSGYERKPENVKNAHSEWFEVGLDVAKNAIKAAKRGDAALSNSERISELPQRIIFRPNQEDAIRLTSKAIKSKRKEFLWNAKMRFGKTSTAMEVARVNGLKRVLIITHRPSVGADWRSDFNLVLGGTDYEYSSKNEGEKIETLLKKNKPFVYFASIQDLRLSKAVVGDESVNSKSEGFDKNNELFATTWDMLIVDEAHEGTQSELGDATIAKIPTKFTLHLSGTPFNIMHKHEEEGVYTWDYVMEQSEKGNWDQNHPGVPNPYAELPSISIFTYDIDTFASHIGKLGDSFHDSLDGAFKFHEFFRVHKDAEGRDTAEFVHEEMVKKFLNLLADDKLETKFPYATEDYRNYNKHALWLLPNRVKVIEAMEGLLKKHNVFSKFGIVNISGNNHDDEEDIDAKKRVESAIKNNEYTITLTGQRLTTGASIKEWTAVLMMSDTNSASSYLQTAFRCQTPAKIDGKLKTQGYVFDFAPDRTLRLVAEAIELNRKSGKNNSPEQKSAMGEFLNFCPILAAEGGKMKEYDVDKMLMQLKKAIIERVSRNGFDDPKLYNDELLQLDELAIEKFNNLERIIGKSTKEQINEIKINNLGMDEFMVEQAEKLENKPKKELTEAEQEALGLLKEARKQKQTAVDILRAVSIRMPMMVYGANVSIHENITLNKFIDLVDSESWKEFMPVGLSKEQFKDFTKYYDEDVFKGVAHSIRAKAFDCDDLLPTERIQAIAEIFSTFKNPDKETVLTPWSVVNLHLTTAFGGYDFRIYDSSKKDRPEWVSKNVDTSVWSGENAKILEINSKSGLYPLLAAYNIYSEQLKKSKKPEDEVANEIWSKVLADNIYVLCKTPMAASITQRTLAGYGNAKTNIIHIDNLVKKLQHEGEFKDYELRNELLKEFKIKDKDMKFTAVVGNPPYQQEIDGRGDQPPIYNLFLDESFKLSEVVSMIHPARFLFNAGLTPKEWNKKMLHDKHFKVLYYKQDSSKIFPNTDIKGGVAISLRNSAENFGEIEVFTSFPELTTILYKVEERKEFNISGEITGRGVYRLTEIALKEHPEIESLQSKGHKTDIGTGAFNILKDILFFEQKPLDGKNYIQILGLRGARRVYYWVDERYVNNPQNFEKYKVILPNVNGSGVLGETLSTPLIGGPFVGYTETFLGFGAFDTEAGAIALMKYLKSKFTRTMLGILKITQHNSRDKWVKVPLQDFTSRSDIDWSKSIPEIDKQLYKKYKLNNTEVDFIETNVKAMV